MAGESEKGIVQELQNIHLAIAQLRIALDDIKKNYTLYITEEVRFKKAKFRNDAEKSGDDFIKRLLSSFLTYKTLNEELTNLVTEFVEYLSGKGDFGVDAKIAELQKLLRNNMSYSQYFQRVYHNFGLMEAFEEIPEELPAKEAVPAESQQRAQTEAGGAAPAPAAQREVFQSFKIKCEDINDPNRFTRLIGKVYKDCCEKYNVYVAKEVKGEWIKARRAADILPHIAHEMENAAKGHDGYVRIQVVKENDDYTINIEYAGK